MFCQWSSPDLVWKPAVEGNHNISVHDNHETETKYLISLQRAYNKEKNSWEMEKKDQRKLANGIKAGEAEKKPLNFLPHCHLTQQMQKL